MPWLDLSAKIDAVKRELDGIDEAIGQAMHDRGVLKAQMIELAAECNALGEEETKLAAEVCRLETRIQSCQLVTELRAHRATADTARVQQLKTEIAEMRRQLHEDAKAFVTDSTAFQTTCSLETLEDRKAAIDVELADCKAEREAVSEQLHQLVNTQQELQRKAADRAEANRQMRNELEGVRAVIDSEASRQQDLKAELDDMMAASRAPLPDASGSAAKEGASLAQEAGRLTTANQAAQQRIRTKAEELAQLRRTIGALTGPPQEQRHEPPQQPQQPRPQQPREWAEFYDLDSSPEGGSNGQSREQLGVFARSTPTRGTPRSQQRLQYTVEEPDSPRPPGAQRGSADRPRSQQRPRMGCLVEETTVQRTTTPVKRRHGNSGEPDWRHEETVTVRRVRRVAASEAQQHVGSGASGGPGIKTVLLHETHEAFEFGTPAGTAHALSDLARTGSGNNSAPPGRHLAAAQQEGGSDRRRAAAPPANPERVPPPPTQGTGGGCGRGGMQQQQQRRQQAFDRSGTAGAAMHGRGGRGATRGSGGRNGGLNISGGGRGGAGGQTAGSNDTSSVRGGNAVSQAKKKPRPTMRRMYGKDDPLDPPPPPDPDADLLVDF